MRYSALIGAALVTTSAVATITRWGVRKLKTAGEGVATAPAELQRSEGQQQRVALIVNPSKANVASCVEQVSKACQARGFAAPYVLETTVADPGGAQARKVLDGDYTTVLVAGGDGTVRFVAHELAHTDLAMGLVPSGTGNLLARHIGIPVNDPARAIGIALDGPSKLIDMGKVVLNDARGAVSEECFLVMGGIGLDAQVIEQTRESLKSVFGWLAYSEAGIRLLPGDRQRMFIQLDGERAQSRLVRTILFANLGTLPAGLNLIQGASIDDGLLDIVILSPRTLLGWIKIVLKTVLRLNREIEDIDFYRAREVVVSTSEPTKTQMDGDLSATSVGVKVSVLSHCLRMRMPLDQ